MQVLQLILKWCTAVKTPFQNECCKFRKNEKKKMKKIENRKKCLYEEWFKRTKSIQESRQTIGATGTDTVSLECLHAPSDNWKARGHPLRDDKVANFELLKGSFWFLLVWFFWKKKQKTKTNPNPALWIMESANLERVWSQGFNDIQGYCEQKSSHISHYGVHSNFSQVRSTSQLWQDTEPRSGPVMCVPCFWAWY